MRKLISLITLLSFSVQAATITDDKLTVGKKASASAKEIVFDTNDGAANKKLSVDKVTKKLSITSDETIVGDGTQSDKALTFNRGGSNAQVKWNELTDKLQFSNDGTTFKDLGTGGGGGGSTGVNVLTNDSFEDAVGGVLTDWSNTGGTLTQQTYTNSVEGDAKYFQFVATGAGQYFEMVKTVPTNFNGQGCQVDFNKLNIATADLFKVEALDGSNNVLASANVGVSSWQKFPTLSFACPSAGSTFKIRVTSLAAGTLQGDKAYLGSNQNIVNLTQSKLFATSSWAATAGCLWSTVSASWTDPAANASCNNPVVSGNATVPVTKVPRINLTNAPAGDYYFVATGMFWKGSAGQSTFRFSDGVVHSNPNSMGVSGSVSQIGSVVGWLPKTSFSATWEVKMQLATTSGATTQIENDTAANFEDFQIQVYYFPAGQETAVNPDQASWFIDANIGGATITMNSTVASYSGISNAGLDLVVNSNKGSANAEIACISGTASVGSTCNTPAVAESLGIAFLPPSSGVYEVCAAFPSTTQTTGGHVAYQLVETSNTAETILQEGGQRISNYSSSSDVASTHFTCGTFKFSDTSKKTIRLMFEKPNTTIVAIPIDRDSSLGQRDMKWTVRPLLSAYNRPILTGDQVTTKGAVNPKIASFDVSSSVITNNESGVVTSCTTADPIVCTFNSSFWATTPKCWAEPRTPDATAHIFGTTTTTSVSINVMAASNAVTVFCHGQGNN